MAAIRPIQPGDVAAVRQQFYAHLSDAVKAAYLTSHPTEAARVERILLGHEGICLVAEDKKIIIGFIIGSVPTEIAAGIRYANIENIRIVPDRRGQGIGSELLKQFRSQVKAMGATRISVEVSPSNEMAIRFYRRHELSPSTVIMESAIAL